MHARAMEAPTPDSVKAPFAGERFSLHGVTTTFSREGSRFVVRTDGPEGTLQDFDVSYTFGVEPLQQYLLPLPGGRYQALSISWDTRAAAAGGQRWFHLYPQHGASRRRRPALDEPFAELERALRGVPFDQPAQGLRRGAQQLQDNLVGHQRGVRILSRRRVTPRRLGARTLVHSAARGQ